MPSDQNYRNEIEKYKSHAALLTLWQGIESRNTPGWDAGKAFEYLVLRAFELEGADVRYPYSVEIGGEIIEQIDGAIYSEGLACIVETKHHSASKGIDVIAKLRNQLMRRPSSTIGVVFSYSGFTEPAKILAGYIAPQTVLLWEGREVEYALQNTLFVSGLTTKYRYCIEEGMPNYNIQIGGI